MRFLWYDDKSENIGEYRMKVHVFGAKSSASIANYALQRVVRDNPNGSQESKECILNNFYVDDLLESAGTVDEVKQLIKEVKDLTAKGGCNLTSFSSNSKMF